VEKRRQKKGERKYRDEGVRDRQQGKGETEREGEGERVGKGRETGRNDGERKKYLAFGLNSIY
jgi:hypothetical protein